MFGHPETFQLPVVSALCADSFEPQARRYNCGGSSASNLRTWRLMSLPPKPAIQFNATPRRM